MIFVILGSLFVMSVGCILDMNALLDRFHNFILPYLRGADRVCGCNCGRQHAYHVIPYDGDRSTFDSAGSYFLRACLTKQELDFILGLLLGLCFFWLFLWLDGVLHSALTVWAANLQHDMESWLTTRFSKLKELCKRMYLRQSEASSGNMVHIEQKLYHEGHRSL